MREEKEQKDVYKRQLVFFIGIIPLALYKLDKPGYMEGVRERLTARDKAKREAEAAEKAAVAE